MYCIDLSFRGGVSIAINVYVITSTGNKLQRNMLWKFGEKINNFTCKATLCWEKHIDSAKLKYNIV